LVLVIFHQHYGSKQAAAAYWAIIGDASKNAKKVIGVD